MCEFKLDNGITHYEADYAEFDGSHGWRAFPFKKDIVEVKLNNRIINPKDYPIPGIFKGFAIHWIGASIPGEAYSYVAREIMLVMKNRKVMCFCLNLKSKRWHDYIDNLKSPERPHLINYDLSQQGM